jgi:predicted GIY-YIG superfamily endonuclease
MFYVYLITSIPVSTQRYTSLTDDLKQRLHQHNLVNQLTRQNPSPGAW